jgi:UDP-N-acetylmuramoyl-tripeptide--D-alanyl-D-alanine ligase
MFNASYIDLGILAFFFIWGVGALRAILFWLYLWQLKDYHIGRFVDHFRTSKGRKSIVTIAVVIKILLVIWLSGAYFFNDWGYLIWGVPAFFLIYAIEDYRTLTGLLRGTIKRPVFTKKIIFLFSIIVAGMIVLAYYPGNGILLLLFDICAPIIVTVVVLLAQPFFVAARGKILQKAKEKVGRFPKLKVIAITGSYGKTSTKEFLSTILAERFKVLATPDHKNSEIGIAQTILQELTASHEIFIVEMGAYNKGGIKLLCDMVRPSIGVVAGVNEQHLATFGSLENLLSAEGGRELLENLPQTGLLIVNGENKYCLDLYKRAKIDKKVYTLSKERIESDIWAEEVSAHTDSLDFVARVKSGELAHLHVKVLGKQHVQNVLGAVLTAKHLGMTMDQISHGTNNITQKQGGMALRKGAHGIHVVDSSYSANPDGVSADLDYLSIFPGKKVIVMPCLIELGQKSIEVHIQIGKKIAEICDMAIITTKDAFEEIRNGAIMNGMDVKNIVFCEHPKEIMAIIGAHCKEGDAVLLEGRVPAELITLLNGKQI